MPNGFGFERDGAVQDPEACQRGLACVSFYHRQLAGENISGHG